MLLLLGPLRGRTRRGRPSLQHKSQVNSSLHTDSVRNALTTSNSAHPPPCSLRAQRGKRPGRDDLGASARTAESLHGTIDQPLAHNACSATTALRRLKHHFTLLPSASDGMDGELESRDELVFLALEDFSSDELADSFLSFLRWGCSSCTLPKHVRTQGRGGGRGGTKYAKSTAPRRWILHGDHQRP
jgi:hypothetical protein